MQPMGVAPRYQTWELEDPRYRVCFWAGTASDKWEVSGADVQEVLVWTEANRGDRTYTLYACVPQDGLGLIRLAGVDPNELRGSLPPILLLEADLSVKRDSGRETEKGRK